MAVKAGASIRSQVPTDLTVVVTLQIQNLTKYDLYEVEGKPGGGKIKSLPPVVASGYKEMMVAHKKPIRATGSYGVLYAKIAGKNRRIAIMWSAPFDFNIHSNWLAVGITNKKYTTVDPDWFDQMYYGRSDEYLSFTRKEYKKDVSSITFEDSEFEILASMGTSHKPEIEVIFRPQSDSDLAPSLK